MGLAPESFRPAATEHATASLAQGIYSIRPLKFIAPKLFSGTIATVLSTIGTSMLIDGVTSMLTPQQQTFNPTNGQDSIDPAALASNYSFTGLTNISNAGVPVNLVYGEILVGSIVVSNGVDTVQVEGNN